MYRAWSYIGQNRLDEAAAEIKTLLQTPASRAVPVATMGRVHGRKGGRDAARLAIDELERLSSRPSFDIAKVHSELRNREQALDWLRRADAERTSAVLYINVDPTFAWLRGDPQFDDLLRSLRLN
jgi:hypothetical protein